MDCVDVRLLKKLKTANCYMIAYGVEFCSQKALDSHNKGWQLEKTMDVFNKTKEAGIGARALLLFNQYDSLGAVEIKRQADDMIVFLKKLKPSEILFAPLIISPNSPMYAEILNEGSIDADGYKELFRRRHIPSRRISNDEMERSILKVFFGFSFRNRIIIAARHIAKILNCHGIFKI
jgi:radical SAM superfamily enzyme YgiQ (UPF0313 family)